MADKKFVFISYSSKDREYVDLIIRLLENMGVAYWVAPQMIPAGSSYAREIPQAIKNCSVFLLVVSDMSQNSIWVEKELDSAISNRKNIIPFQVDSTPLNELFRFYLNNIQIISGVSKHEVAMGELKQRLEMILGIEHTNQPKTAKATSPIEVESAGANKKKATKKVKGLSPNRIPVRCEYCGGLVRPKSKGIYECVSCGQENYDDFQTIRRYLEKEGATPSMVIAMDTGVPKEVIDYFFREEYLEIPKSSSFRMSCENCGAPIRTGTLCDRCKSRSVKPSSSGGAKWHTGRR